MKKNVVKTMTIATAVAVFLLLGGCKKETSTPNAEITHSKLFNKCWYNKSSTAYSLDEQYYTTGNRIGLICGNNTGTWQWLGGDTMLIKITGNPDRIQVYKEISDHKMVWSGHLGYTITFEDTP